MPRNLLFSLVVSLAPVSLVAGQQPTSGSRIGAPDVWLVVHEALVELRLVSSEMGVRVPEPLGVRYIDAAPREVFIQAALMLDKIRTLTLDMKLRPPVRVAVPHNAINPLHVMGVAQQGLLAVQDVKRLLGIEYEHKSPQRDATKTATDVLAVVTETNRLLNSIIETPTRPRDVFRQVSLAIRYLKTVSGCVGVELIEAPQPFVRLRIPADVYVRLLGCFVRVRLLAAAQGIGTLRVDAPKLNRSLIQPSDVHDLAVLLVAELKHLDKEIGKGESQRPVRHTGLCFPSHVHQRAVQLDVMLVALSRGLRSRGLQSRSKQSPRPPGGRSK